MRFDLKALARQAQKRMRKRHVALGVLALLLIWKPLWVLFVAFSLGAVAFALITMIGLDTVWRYGLARIAKLHRYDPARAERILVKLEHWAYRTDRILDALPSYIAEPLYFPDLQSAIKTPVAGKQRAVVPLRPIPAE